MVLRSSLGEHSRLTRVVVLSAILLGLRMGNWQSDAQLQASAPSQQVENGGYAQLKLMESSVIQLASSLSDVYPTTCDEWKTCDVCTQDECRPLNGNLACANVSHNTRCNNHFPNCSSTIRVTMERSALAYPRDSLESEPDFAQTRSICGTTGLDSTFKDLFKQNKYHADYYVGFPDGIRRSFPGREEGDPNSFSCPKYDCRKRPWYNAAISNKNHLVILVDSRKKEPLDPSYTQRSDTLTFAKELADELLSTVYNNDRVNIVPFSSAAEAAALEKTSVRVEFDPGDPGNHKELDTLIQSLADLGPAQDDVKVTSSNLTAGLQEALRLFDATSGMVTQNIVVFTNGDISYDVALNLTVDQVAKQLVRLFIFSMKNTDYKLQALEAVAKRAAGAHIRLTTSVNKLYQLHPYFDYLARLQAESKRTMPFWTPSYRDYYDVGEIITVVAPVREDGMVDYEYVKFMEGTDCWDSLTTHRQDIVNMYVSSNDYSGFDVCNEAAFSKSGPKKLIGVAAIDVLYFEIGDLQDEFQDALHSRPYEEGSIDADTFNSVTVYEDSTMDSCDIDGIRNVMCKEQVTGDKKENFLDRMCCRNCAEGKSGGNRRTLLIAILTSVFGSLLVISSCVIVICCFACPRRVVEDSNPSVHDKRDSVTPSIRTSSDSLLKVTEEPSAPARTPRQIYQSTTRLWYTNSISSSHQNLVHETNP